MILLVRVYTSHNKTLMTNYILFDFETGGLDVVHTPPLQLTGRNGQDGSVLFNMYIRPHKGAVISEKAIEVNGITDQVLLDNNAIALSDALEQVVRIVRKTFGRKSVVWVAYNTFGFDQLVLEYSFKRAGLRMPDCWRFMDLLPLCRDRFVVSNYRLSTVHAKLVTRAEGAEPFKLHDSLGDTLCLFELFHACQDICGEDLFPRYTRPKMDSIHMYDMPLDTTLSGYDPAMKFNAFGYHTIGHVFQKFRDIGCDTELFVQFLMNDLKVFKDYRAKRITQQMRLINALFHSNAM